MARFVILEHTFPAGRSRATHWDLMFEQSSGLATWALGQAPLVSEPIWAEQLTDHRFAYLDYEGPVSGDRGDVAQWDAGEYSWSSVTANQILGRLSGERRSGRFELLRDPPTGVMWQFRWLDEVG